MKRAARNENGLLEVFAFLFGARWLNRWVAGWHRAHPAAPRFRARCFTLRLTLWCMIWQRRRGGAALQEVMAQVEAGQFDGLGSRKRGKLSRRLKSGTTSAFNAARQRLPVALAGKGSRRRQGDQRVSWIRSRGSQIPRGCQGPEMVEREFYVGILVHNLVRTLMWPSAQRNGTDASKSSFSQARTRLVVWMEQWSFAEPVTLRSAPRWLRRIRRQIARCLLPTRRRPRPSEARMVRRRRPSKFPEFSGDRLAARSKFRRLAKQQDRGTEKTLFQDA